MKIVYASIVVLGLSVTNAHAYAQASNYAIQDNIFGDNVIVQSNRISSGHSHATKKIVKVVNKHYKTEKNITNNYNIAETTVNVPQTQTVIPQQVTPQQVPQVTVNVPNQQQQQVPVPAPQYGAPNVTVNVGYPPPPHPECVTEISRIDSYGNAVPPHQVRSVGCYTYPVTPY